jgi:hypothetical protein
LIKPDRHRLRALAHCLWLLVAFVVMHEAIGAVEPAAPRKTAAIQEAMTASSKTPETVAGRYLMRNFIARDEQAAADEVEKSIRTWQKVLKESEEAYRRSVLDGGGTMTEEEEKMLAENYRRDLAHWTAVSKRSASPTLTRYCSVSVKNQRYRFEQVNLPDDVPLKELAEKIRSGEIDVASDAAGRLVVTWDATEANMMNVQVAQQTSGNAETSGLTRVGSEPITPIPDFFNAGRLSRETGNTLLRAAANDGASIGVEDVASKAIPGARAEKVTIKKSVLGIPLFSGYEMTTTVLPEQGYVVESETMSTSDVEISRDIHADFQPTAAGFWFPKNVVRERYESDPKTNERRLKSRLEYLAINDVEFNAPLDDALFRLRGTQEFDALPTMDFGTQPDRVGLDSVSPRFFRWGLMLLTALSWVVIVWAIRRRNRARQARPA